MTEAEIQHAILAKWGADSRVRLWRANSGKAWVETSGGMRPMQVNIPGCPDLIGWCTVEGRAVFLGIEVKSAKGRQRAAQRAFEDVLVMMGGVYVLAKSVRDVDAALEPLLKKESE